MLEKIKPINNPLTIIGLFAALSDIASTVAITLMPLELQKTFLWFVMGFPFSIMLVFFLILWLKREALYAPGDYKDEQNFITALRVQSVSINLEEASQQLETAGKQILDKVIIEIGSATEKEIENIKKTVNQSLTPLRNTIVHTKDAAEDVLWSNRPVKYNEKLLSRIFAFNDLKSIEFTKLLEVVPKSSHTEFMRFLMRYQEEGYIKIEKGLIFSTPKLQRFQKNIEQINNAFKGNEPEKQ